jgi:quinol monooxygenase YgiN
MIKYRALDDRLPISKQIQHPAGPVVFLNIFTIDPDEAPQFEAAWAEDAAYFKKQTGCISAQLHRSVGGANFYINYAVWESVEHFRAANSTPEFKSHLEAYPPSTTATPSLFQTVHVPNMCLGVTELNS